MKLNMYKSYIPYLQHILDECHYIQSVITDDVVLYEFLSDETLKRAVVRSLSIIGEATKKIPADVKYEWSEISWKEFRGRRWQECVTDWFTTIWGLTILLFGM